MTDKHYPMYQQFVDQKDKWIGGTLVELSDGITDEAETEIEDVRIDRNENYDAFEVVGKDFSCSFNTMYGGVGGGQDGWIKFSSPYFSFMIHPA